MSPLLIVLNFLQCFVESREPNHVTIQPGANALGISGLSPQEASGQWMSSGGDLFFSIHLQCPSPVAPEQLRVELISEDEAMMQ
ncbi:unnamed protein product [Trifolium pratense]|uniref:Uncharacterized protein n=1 Tax=Trifolium pratense TaxID=57577 RepID=A0ACB0LSP6_TRIPR|nr:unnamed protein product [Trifolium pratense]